MIKLLKKCGIESKHDFKKLIVQFIKFGIVGVSNTLISLAIYYVLVYFNCNYIVANTLGFIISVLNAYYWNNKYVFKSKEKANGAKDKVKQLVKVYMSYGVTFLLSTVLLYVMVDLMHISEYIAPIINLCITVPLNFVMNKLWAFKK